MPEAEQRADVIAETVRAGLIEADRRPDPRPRPVKQRGHAMVKDVEEPTQRMIAMIADSFAHVFRDMESAWPLADRTARRSVE